MATATAEPSATAAPSATAEPSDAPEPVFDTAAEYLAYRGYTAELGYTHYQDADAYGVPYPFADVSLVVTKDGRELANVPAAKRIVGYPIDERPSFEEALSEMGEVPADAVAAMRLHWESMGHDFVLTYDAQRHIAYVWERRYHEYDADEEAPAMEFYKVLILPLDMPEAPIWPYALTDALVDELLQADLAYIEANYGLGGDAVTPHSYAITHDTLRFHGFRQIISYGENSISVLNGAHSGMTPAEVIGQMGYGSLEYAFVDAARRETDCYVTYLLGDYIYMFVSDDAESPSQLVIVQAAPAAVWKVPVQNGGEAKVYLYDGYDYSTYRYQLHYNGNVYFIRFEDYNIDENEVDAYGCIELVTDISRDLYFHTYAARQDEMADAQGNVILNVHEFYVLLRENGKTYTNDVLRYTLFRDDAGDMSVIWMEYNDETQEDSNAVLAKMDSRYTPIAGSLVEIE